MKRSRFKKLICRAAALPLAFLFMAQFSACAPKVSTALRTVCAMSTVVTFQITGPEAERACDEMEAALKDFEQETSTYIDNSEVARVNMAAGKELVEVAERVYYVISRGVEAARETGGLFDISIGPLASLWDIMSPTPRAPQPEEIAAATALVDYRDITLSTGGGRYTVALKREGQRLDLGGIAKGYALDIFREILNRRGMEQGLISIGGNIMVYRDKAGGPYTIGIRYPFPGGENGYFCALEMADTTISTSGGYERFFVQDGVTYHHIIDPRTGYPAQSGLLSVSVIHPDGLTADYLSTALFVGGLEYALDWMKAGGQAIVVDSDNRVYLSKSLRASVVRESCDTGHYTFRYV